MDNGNGISTYLEQKPENFQIIAKRLVEIIQSSNPDMNAEIKWGKPTFGLNGDFHHWICAVQILVEQGDGSSVPLRKSYPNKCLPTTPSP